MNTCFECGSTMVVSHEDRVYDESGLHYVVLENAEIRRCTQCDAIEYAIQSIDNLHSAIAHALITKEHRLIGHEIRFLRTHLGFDQRTLGSIMGVTNETISRWETNHDSMSLSADHLLRLLIAFHTKAEDYSFDYLARVQNEPREIRLRLIHNRSGWHAHAA